MIWRDPSSELECRCEITQYADFPAVEWILYFKNCGSMDSPVFEDIQTLDCGMPLEGKRPARPRNSKGSECKFDDFAPLSKSLGPGENEQWNTWFDKTNPFCLESKGGRSSNGTMPFFNLDMSDHGVIAAIGWTGDWKARFYRTDAEVHMSAGMRRTHLKLLPGEEIRLPRILLMFWHDDPMCGHTLFRQLILTHYSPRIDGELVPMPLLNATWGANYADEHVDYGRRWKEQGLPLERLWIDPGWYWFGADDEEKENSIFTHTWWKNVGNWRPNPRYFPEGLKPVGDALDKMGIGFTMWIEPERVHRDAPWANEHPEWLLGPLGDSYLVNLGVPEARRTLTDLLSNLIAEGNIGFFRQDFNIDPRSLWEQNDAPDRVGITEIRHITGLYAMWDELRTRHPGLIIDNCSSGGRRIDLETISRSVVLWRSDTQCIPGFNPTPMQNQTHGLSFWTPLSSGVCDREDTYAFRSALGPGMDIILHKYEDLGKHISVSWLKDRLKEFHSVRDYFLGDFYPLQPYSLAEDVWAAWQYDRPDLGEGVILAFRRPASPLPLTFVKLQNLDPDAEYEFRDADTKKIRRVLGIDLRDAGLKIEIKDQPGSRLLIYKKLSS